jgi:hypothetical protein
LLFTEIVENVGELPALQKKNVRKNYQPKILYYHFQAGIRLIDCRYRKAQQMPRRVSATHIILNLPVVSISDNFLRLSGTRYE